MSGRSEKFFSKSDLLGKENHYSIFKRTPTDEFSGGYHYHDFFEATYYHSLTDTPSIALFSGTKAIQSGMEPLSL